MSKPRVYKKGGGTSPLKEAKKEYVYVKNIVKKEIKLKPTWTFIIILLIFFGSSLYLYNDMLPDTSEFITSDYVDDAIDDIDTSGTSTTAVVSTTTNPFNQTLNSRDDVHFGDITMHGSSNFTGAVIEGPTHRSPEVRAGIHGGWDTPVVFFDDGTDGWGIDMLVGGSLRFFVPADVIMALTDSAALIDVPLDVTGDLDVTGNINASKNIIATNITSTRNMTVGDNLYLTGIIDMGADGFRVSPTDDGSSIRFEIGVGGDISMAGTFTNDGNLRILGDSYLGNGPTDNTYVNGTLYVDGSVSVDENITAYNVFIPSYLRMSSKSTIPVATSGVWENITFNHSYPKVIQGFDHTWDDDTNDTLTINNSGVYKVSYFICCEDSDVTPDAHVGFRLINATDQTIIKGSYGEFDTTKMNSHVFKEHNFITTFENRDKIKVQFTSDDTTVTMLPHITFNPTGPSCQLSIHKIANI